VQKLARPLAFYTGLACVASLLAYAGRWSWACELLVNFRTHFALLLGLALLLAAALRRWRVVALAAAGLALNAWPMHGAWSGAETAPAGGRAVRVVEFNVHVANDDFKGIASYLDSLDPDVVVLAEMTTWSADQLSPLLPRLPHRYVAVDEGFRGVLILSRWPLVVPQTLVHEGTLYGARANVDLGDRQFLIYGVHLNWPVVPEAERERNAQLVALGQELAGCQSACVLVGDFNITPWSSHYRNLLDHPGVRDCAAGRGWQTTWNSRLPAVLRIRIDHCVLAGAVSAADVQVGQSVGSDHLATINDLLMGTLPVS
jgi:endonuclease/exonuclease/phosphatase (EEP) superfamily protein YafD